MAEKGERGPKQDQDWCSLVLVRDGKRLETTAQRLSAACQESTKGSWEEEERGRGGEGERRREA
eukprot:1826298-Rhodomonas_salina.1